MRDQDNRKHERDSLFLMAELRLERDGAPYAVKLRNISDSGLMAEGSMRVIRGSEVWVDLCNIGLVAGKVAWAAGDRCGIAFNQAVESAKVRFPVTDVDLPDDENASGHAERSDTNVDRGA
ncbi:PilZ domain-containing protein [Croceicoccus sediminis]|uniref:PilZ domain-containing protein n=1 Tax=Croceicoccus sediminis TaxID=2571150 RepID=UPI001183F535|nr:PilZ domain-containing protein [Croceicoccus sediminis]